MPRKLTGKLINCEICKKEFYISPVHFRTKRFCSHNCSFIGRKGKIPWNKNTQIINCIKCGKEIEVSPSRVGNQKFCSKRCSLLGGARASGKRSEEAKKNIIAGGTTFKKGLIPWNTNRAWTEEERVKMSLGQQKRVSDPNYINPNRGKRSIESIKYRFLREGIERLVEYKDWRRDVLKRDNYRCCVLGCKNKKLNVHHMTEVREIIRLYKLETLEDALNCPLLWKRNNGVVLCVEHHKNAHKPNFNNFKKIKWKDREEFENFYKQQGLIHLIT